MRVSAFIDGFNLYHALDDTRLHYLKWVDLRKLCLTFAPAPAQVLGTVHYFSAFATWRPDAYARHRAFVKALRACGVTPVMGKFKEKARACRRCGSQWKDHEEKETDVNIGLYLLKGAFEDAFDRALIVSGDSDLAPAVRMVKGLFPHKDVRILTPIDRNHSMDLVNAAGGLPAARKIDRLHLERSLLPEIVYDNDKELARRPEKYRPPA